MTYVEDSPVDLAIVNYIQGLHASLSSRWNDPNTQRMAEHSLTAHMQNRIGDNEITSFTVTCDATNNPPEVVNASLLKIAATWTREGFPENYSKTYTT